MPTTLLSLLIAVAAVMPGFVTVELTQRQRAVQVGGDAQSGRDARDAWDLIFQRATTYGAWVLVHLKGDTPDLPRLVLGKYGKRSMAGQSPAEHDLFLQEMWAIDELGYPVTELHPSRGMWIAKDGIAELYLLDEESFAKVSHDG